MDTHLKLGLKVDVARFDTIDLRSVECLNKNHLILEMISNKKNYLKFKSNNDLVLIKMI